MKGFNPETLEVQDYRQRAQIDANCKDCIYDDKSGLGTWREQVARCTCVRCAIWPIRTGPSGGRYMRERIDVIIARCPTRADENGA